MSKRKRRKPTPRPRARDAGPIFPAASVAQYGPDDRSVTKIVAGVTRELNGPVEELTRWVATDVAVSPVVRRKLLAFFEAHRVRRVIYAAGVIGCIHEEGKDYPQGQPCPFCPFWQGRDRWANAKPMIMTVAQFEEAFWKDDT